MRGEIRKVAIVGGGPAGSLLAGYLARAGREVAIFAGPRPPLLIGESLVPAVVPYLRDLGIEDEVASYSIFKPGASFVIAPERVMNFTFGDIRKAKVPYSYNTPRDRFDESFARAAERAGATRIHELARVERVGRGDRVRLRPESLEAVQAAFEGEPDLIVDASGRSRLLSRLLGLPCREGERKDTALFAHMDGVPLLLPHNVHTDILEVGWSWRIPLPGRVSVGVVVNSEHLRKYGDSVEEQFDGYLASDARIRAWGGSPKRCSPVMKYTNYHRATLRGYGENWALVGDAYGFLDPVFSSGLLVALNAAKELARAIQTGGEPAFQHYERHVLRHLRVWQQIVDHFYSGRLFTLFDVGEYVRRTPPGKLLDLHFRKHLPRVFTGERTTGGYSPWLLNFMCRYGLAGNDPARYLVR
jgi:hypothetical protein